MRVIDAFWEKRNLGLDTIEVEIDETDDISEVESKIKDIDAQYIVVKTPSNNINFSILLQKYGFTFIETQIGFSFNLKNKIRATEGELKRTDELIVEYMNDDDLCILYNEIQKGLFDTDRISIDPCFSQKQAADRYIGWIKDELGRNGKVCKFLFKENTVGFFSYKIIDNKIFYSFLGGAYNEFKRNGLGLMTTIKQLKFAGEQGLTKWTTSASLNNLKHIRILNTVGCSMDKATNIFIKHN